MGQPKKAAENFCGEFFLLLFYIKENACRLVSRDRIKLASIMNHTGSSGDDPTARSKSLQVRAVNTLFAMSCDQAQPRKCFCHNDIFLSRKLKDEA